MIGRQTQVEEDATVDGAILWPNCRVSREASVRNAILGRNCHSGATSRVDGGAVLGDKTTLTDYTRARAPDTPSPTDHHADQSRHLQGLRRPRPVSGRDQRRRSRRLIGRGFAAYLKVPTVAVSRDMRVSSPALAAAFIEGVRDQGTDVVDYGMMATDMLYFAVVRDDLGGGAQITASHNPGSTTA